MKVLIKRFYNFDKRYMADLEIMGRKYMVTFDKTDYGINSLKVWNYDSLKDLNLSEKAKRSIKNLVYNYLAEVSENNMQNGENGWTNVANIWA